MFFYAKSRPLDERCVNTNHVPFLQFKERIIARLPNEPTTSRDGPRVNGEITSPKIRLVDENGEMIGVVTRFEGMQMAQKAGLDLVEISPNAEPPVCKVLDYGKHKYEQQKKRAEAKKKQKIVEVKEIQMRPGIDENDYQVKCRAIQRFIEDGDKVKITMRFRGRELSHQEIGMSVLTRLREQFEELAKVEQMPRLEGKQMIMVLVPK
jgi:translation initiation factor IF-3